MSETIAQNRVFIYEPQLVPQIAQLVCYDDHIPLVSLFEFTLEGDSTLTLIDRIFKHMLYTPWTVLLDIVQKLQKYWLLLMLRPIMVF